MKIGCLYPNNKKVIKSNKAYDSIYLGNRCKGMFSDALKHRTKSKIELDTNTVETEYNEIWKDREITKDIYGFLSPREIKSISDKHKPCESVCCSAKKDLEELGILEEYREHMRRENQK